MTQEIRELIDRILGSYDEMDRRFTAAGVGSVVGAVKTIVDGDGKLLGAHLLGHNADEVVNVFAGSTSFSKRSAVTTCQET